MKCVLLVVALTAIFSGSRPAFSSEPLDREAYDLAKRAWSESRIGFGDGRLVVKTTRRLEMSSRAKPVVQESEKTFKILERTNQVVESVWLEHNTEPTGDLSVSCTTRDHSFLVTRLSNASNFVLLNYLPKPTLPDDIRDVDLVEFIRPICLGIIRLDVFSEVAKLESFSQDGDFWRAAWVRDTSVASDGRLVLDRATAVLHSGDFKVSEYELEFSGGVRSDGVLTYETGSSGERVLVNWTQTTTRRGKDPYTDKVNETYVWSDEEVREEEFTLAFYGLDSPQKRSSFAIFAFTIAIVFVIAGILLRIRNRRVRVDT